MQRKSGRVVVVPDEFVITSLDIIIYHERKLGAGGFAEVYEADWKGTRVAVKVLEKGVPPSVSHMSNLLHVLDMLGHRLYNRKSMSGSG